MGIEMTAEFKAQGLLAYLKDYPRQMAFGDEDPEAVVDRHFAPGFTMVNDGRVWDRAKLLAHVRPVRKNAVSVDVEVHETLIDGDRVAARYTMTAALRKAAAVATDIHLFGRLAEDGRIRELHQITREAS